MSGLFRTTTRTSSISEVRSGASVSSSLSVRMSASTGGAFIVKGAQTFRLTAAWDAYFRYLARR